MVVHDVEAPLSLRERYTGLLFGSLVADALTLAAHWEYNQEKLLERWGRVTDFQAPAADGYHKGKELGAQTHYGDQALVLMESLEATGGNFVMEDFARRWRRFAEEAPAYKDHATKDTLVNLQKGLGLTRAGSDSTELGGSSRIAPLLVALRSEDAPVVIAAVRAQTALTHATPAVLDLGGVHRSGGLHADAGRFHSLGVAGRGGFPLPAASGGTLPEARGGSAASSHRRGDRGAWAIVHLGKGASRRFRPSSSSMATASKLRWSRMSWPEAIPPPAAWFWAPCLALPMAAARCLSAGCRLFAPGRRSTRSLRRRGWAGWVEAGLIWPKDAVIRRRLSRIG